MLLGAFRLLVKPSSYFSNSHEETGTFKSHEATGTQMTPPQQVDPRLFAAYERTLFKVRTNTEEIVLRVGVHSVDADNLLKSAGVSEAAYLTAFNPGSRMLSDSENQCRQDQLLEYLHKENYVFLAGTGIADDGSWPGEESVLILGIDRSEANAIASTFGQTAFVHVEIGKHVELVATRFDHLS